MRVPAIDEPVAAKSCPPLFLHRRAPFDSRRSAKNNATRAGFHRSSSAQLSPGTPSMPGRKLGALVQEEVVRH